MFKWTDFALLIVIIFIPYSLYISINQSAQAATAHELFYLNEIIESAVEDATTLLLKSVTSINIDSIAEGKFYIEEIEPDKEKAIKQFYQSLYLNLGLENDAVGQMAMKTYLPLKMIILKNGYYHTYINNYGDEVWSKKVYYGFKNFAFVQNSDDIIFLGGSEPVRTNFQDVLNNELKDPYGDIVYEKNIDGTLKLDAGGNYIPVDNPVALPIELQDINVFRNYRDVIITKHIKDTLEYYTYVNSIRLNYKSNYSFTLPTTKNEDYNNVITNTAFVAIMNGCPIKGIDMVFNTYGFGGTKVKKALKYIGITKYNANYDTLTNQWNKVGTYLSKTYDVFRPEGTYIEIDTINSYVYEYRLFDTRIEAARDGYTPN